MSTEEWGKYCEKVFRGLWLERSQPHVREYLFGLLDSLRIVKEQKENVFSSTHQTQEE